MTDRCRRINWRFVIGSLLVLTLALSSPVRALAQAEASEYALKAAFLYKFASFVEWPPRVFPAADTPLIICIAGTDPFGPLADQAVRGAEFGQRHVDVRRVRSTETSDLCHIMFIGQDGGAPENAQARSVLTITDGERNPNGKGIIHFVIRDNRVRFEIDDRAAQQSGLVISSKLLSLAESVRPKG